MPVADTSKILEQLRQWQNPDGGWGYQANGISWTEPTCFAILALQAGPAESKSPDAEKALEWLKRSRRSDGGWSPQPGVRETTWVTAAAVLALRVAGQLKRDDPALLWLSRTQGAESGWVHRLRQWMQGMESGNGGFDGWPWYPGAAAWVAPTAMTILAVRAALSLSPADTVLTERLRSACGFLVSRRCADGGWNHGSNRALGYDGDSYPETTGMALLALAGSGVGSGAEPALQRARQTALAHYAKGPSLEAWCWLQMGLRAHGIVPAGGVAPPPVPAGQTREAALYLLANRTLEGENPWNFEGRP